MKYTRRGFLGRTVGAGAALSVGPMMASGSAAEPGEEGIRIHVSGPAGPAPLGAPVETSVPFGRGKLRDISKWGVYTPEGKEVLSQMRAGMKWPDGSVRWLSVVFEAEAGPGDYVLREGEGVSGPELVREANGQVVMGSGEVEIRLARQGGGWLEGISAPGGDGKMVAVVQGGSDLVLTRHDGRKFRAMLEGESREVEIEERGPVRASVRVEGKCRGEDGEGLFDYIARWRVYRGRGEVYLTLTWINGTEKRSEQVRDIRLKFPYEFEPERLVFGCETGVFDGPFLKDWPVYLLQEDYNWYWAKKHNPDGRIQNLSSGGCNGERCPGWLYVESKERCLGVWVKNFWEEYPNEIELRDGELRVGLWPERGMKHLLSKPVLPANPDGEQRYVKTKYTPVLPHPYVAFVDEEKESLDAVQGLAKTQEMVLGVWGGKGEGSRFEKKWWGKSLEPVRGHLDPQYVAASGALGLLWPCDRKRFPVIEEMFDQSYDLLKRHVSLLKSYGKFDYGDWKYFTAATDYLCTPGTKWGRLGEMPREGYWQNNEGEQMFGILLYYFRTGNAEVWEFVQAVARHRMDVDIKHHADWGAWTHSYGHCYVATADAGEPDHSWLLGALAWAGVSGDEVIRKWMEKCGIALKNRKIDFTQTDARTTAVYLHMMCQFYRYTGDANYLKAGKPPVDAYMELQNPEGSWPAYMGNMSQPRVNGFTDHAVMALSDYYDLTSDPQVLAALDKALNYVTSPAGIDNGMDISPITIYAFAVLAEKTGKNQYAKAARKLLLKLRTTQEEGPDPYGRGDIWAQWGVNNSKQAEGTGRPPQFLGQTRPISSGFILSYCEPAMKAITTLDDGSV